MKKYVFAAAFLLCFVSFYAQQKAKTQVMYVSTQNAELKEKKSNFSAATAKLSYGQAVTVISMDKKWAEAKLSDGSKRGWISMNSLTKRKIAANSGFSASTDELSLAGKGFTAELEANYKKEGKVDFASVDKIEKNSVSRTELLTFIEEGKLKGGEE